VVKELQDDLRYYYKKKRLTPPKEEWPPDQPTSIVNVALIHYRNRRSQQELDDLFKRSECFVDDMTSSHSRVTKDINKLFTADPLDNSGELPKCILIEGAPGIGKTILAKEIVFRWAKSELERDFILVILVYLRNPQLSSMNSVSELLQMYTSKQKASEVNDYLEKCKGENVAFVFDGFDEFHPKLRETSFIRDLIEGEKGIGKIFYKSTIVVTSRPTATLLLHRVVDRRIEVLGFAKEEREEYISLSLEDSPHKKQELDEYLKQHPVISGLCFVPLHLAILIFLFQIASLPETLTEMNELFVYHIIFRSLNKLDSYSKCAKVQKITDVPDTVLEFVDKLCKLAFLGLQNNQLVFSYNEIQKVCPKIDDTPEAINGFGLLQAVEHYSSEGRTTSFNFLHLTIQEYLAALCGKAFYCTAVFSYEKDVLGWPV